MDLKKTESIYDSMADVGYDMSGGFHAWRERIIFWHETDHGGLAFLEDTHNPDILWVHAHCPGELPEKTVLKWLFSLGGVLGYTYLATESRTEKVSGILSSLGFECVGDDLYSMRLLREVGMGDERVVPVDKKRDRVSPFRSKIDAYALSSAKDQVEPDDEPEDEPDEYP